MDVEIVMYPADTFNRQDDDSGSSESESDSDGEDGFADAPENTTSTSSPPLPARILTRLSQSTVSSILYDHPPSPETATSSLANRNSQASSITPPTTTNGSVHHESLHHESKSPVLARRISAASLDEVSLIDQLPPASPPLIAAVELASPLPVPAVVDIVTPPSPPPPPAPTPSLVESITNRFSRSTTTSTPAPRSRTLSSAFMPSNQPAVTQQPATGSPQPPAPKRSPFSWLRSNTSVAPAPTPQRRGTVSSLTSMASLSAAPANNELLLHRLGSNRDLDKEKEELQRGKDSLRENFKKLRATKGQSVQSLESVGSDAAVKGSLLFMAFVRSKLRFAADTEEVLAAVAEAPSSPESVKAASTKSEDEIDWDLWQAVVDDAFSVASEKPTELNRAIQAGIPPTLRGTIWQSLAASKSLELEAIYRDVIQLPQTATAEDARTLFGCHWLWDPSPAPSQSPSPRLGSRNSSPKIEPKGGQPAMQWGKTIAQLEKVIKRDLGERTSFGKYKVDQKALLNLCKAYALFDPAVGYTQGMTFIATVLLLNVCVPHKPVGSPVADSQTDVGGRGLLCVCQAY